MKRSLFKLITELKSRPATPEEVQTLIEAIKAQEKAVKIQALRAQLKALTAA